MMYTLAYGDVDTDNEKILRLNWNPKEDHLSPRVRKRRRSSDLEHRQVDTKFPDILTRRLT